MKNIPFWHAYEPLIQAIVELFHPFAEAAVHDLKKGKVVAIFHNISRRKVGDPSPLKELKIPTNDLPAYFKPYYKSNWDGQPLKCISVTIRNKKGKPIGLICINVDVSFFQEGHRLLEAFLKTEKLTENPVELFGTFENQASRLIQEYLTTHHLSLLHLNRDQKKEIVQELFQKGIFNFKNAAPFIAKKLRLSRATVYNHLRGNV